MKALLTLIAAGATLGGVLSPSTAEAGDKKKKHKHGHEHVVYHVHDTHYDRYFRDRDVYFIRDHYHQHVHGLPPGLERRYYRTGHLPPGWAKRMRPIPVYIERDLVPVPRGYRRGIINGHAVVYNDSGFILDVAVLF